MYDRTSSDFSDRSQGLVYSVTAFASSLLASIHTRLSLFSIDLEEAKGRFLCLLALFLTAFLCLSVGLILATLLIVVAFWDTHRLLTLGLLTGFFISSGFIALGVALYKVKTKPRLFETSLSELYKDRQHLGPH